jgi:glutathione reductase (NADPH)
MNKQHFDVIAIGGGSGGLAVAEKAALFGKKVAVIEGYRMGGTCVNNGCVPKKVMWYAANLAHAVDDASAFGIPATRGNTEWAKLVEAREQYISNINNYWDGYVDDSGIARIQGYARFLDAKTIEVDGSYYSADHIVIATGGQPIVPPLPGAELGITSDGFFALRAQPRRVAVIGGGYIGVELAGVLRALGSEVTVVALEDRIMERFDPMISCVLENEMQRQGIRIRTGFTVNALSEGEKGLNVHSANEKLEGFDTVIWAVGRRANTASLNLESTGVAMLSNGEVPVDEFENTNVPGIYAIGDITGKAALTPVAIAAGRRLAERLFNGKTDSKVDYIDIPTVVFSHPPIATVGMNEAQAREEFGNDITVYMSDFTPMRYSLNDHGAATGMKLICAGSEERVIGIHVIGEGADEMLQGFAIALKMGATKADFDRTIAIHPSSAEELVTMKEPVRASVPCERSHDIDAGNEWKHAS